MAKNDLGLKRFGPRKCGLQKIRRQKAEILASVENCPRNVHLKFVLNRVSNGGDIPDMDKCCVDECHGDRWNLF